jgi:hypothetical protein
MKFIANISLVFLCLMLGLFLLPSCKKSTDQIQQNTCDTNNMTFSKDITPIFKDNCLGCHSKAQYDASGIMNLESYAVVKLYLDNDYHADGIYGSKLMHIIEQYGSVPNMPPSYKLSTCEISKIQAWINQKAKEN